MNEFLFLLHIAIIFFCTLTFLKWGKEFLFVWIALQAILANFFVLKQIMLFGFQVTCSDAYAVGTVLGLNLLQEYFGKKEANQAIKACFVFMLLFALLSKIQLFYTPSNEDTAHDSYIKLLSPSPRLFLASLLVFFTVQKIDLSLFSYLKKSPILLRNLICLSSSQVLDTILFTFIGLYGLIAAPWDVIIVSSLIKLTAVGLLSPTAWVAKRFIPLNQKITT